MAGISQTIPNYYGGISEQPDQLKNPGQVKEALNVIPDITYGLYKRPGAERVGTAKLSSVQSNGSWFHYHRDEEEGNYIDGKENGRWTYYLEDGAIETSYDIKGNFLSRINVDE